MNDAFDTVRRGYDRIGVAYRERSRDGVVRLHWLRRLLDELDDGGLVLDLGCGPGEPATRLLAERHLRDTTPSGQPGSAHGAARAGRHDADEYPSREPGRSASFYALGHVPADRHRPLLASMAHWLRPGGLLLTSTPLGAGDGHDPSWLGVPMFFGGIGEEATREAVVDAGLAIDAWEVVAEDEGDEHIVQFAWLLARKPD